MGKFKGRSAAACTACHSQKLKCSGESPCNRCILRKRACVYPKKETYVAVPESYLREVEGEASSSRYSAAQGPPLAVESDVSFRPERTTGSSQSNEDVAIKRHLPEDCTAERLIQKLKDLSSSLHPFVQPGPEGSYTYLRVKGDSQDSDMSIKLPPKEYALNLLSVFEDTFCEYHWFLRRDFKDRLASTYPHGMGQTNDRNWLCRLSVVLALAQNQMPASSQDAHVQEAEEARFDGREENSRPWPPGTHLFNQAVQLFESSPDEPCLEDIEALNLLAFYCYSSNRPKSAFVYTSRSIALLRLLSLDQPHLLESHGVTGEHMRRLRWTSYYLECILLVELGLSPLHPCPEALQKPSSSHLSGEDLDQFFDAALLNSRFGLYHAKSVVATAVVDCWRKPDKGIVSIVESCLGMLREWKEELPVGISLDLDEDERTLKAPCARGLASMHLSYYECFTILLRAIYLKEVSDPMQRRPTGVFQEDRDSEIARDAVQVMKLQCLEAAKKQCVILRHVATQNKLGKHSFLDTMHLFSALATLAVSDMISIESKAISEVDARLYSDCRAILEDMAQDGNAAAKDLEALLANVEAAVKEASTGAAQLDVEMVLASSSSPCMDPIKFFGFMVKALGGTSRTLATLASRPELGAASR